MTELFEKIIDNVNTAAKKAATANAEDYKNEIGLLICGKCNTPKQVNVSFNNIHKTVNCLCKCGQAALEKEAAEFAAMQERIEIKRKRSVGIQDKKLISYNFKNDDKQNAQISDLARRYVQNFKEIKKNNCGLLLYGDTGTGKTFYAGCIANALIDNGYSVLATSITRLINQIFNSSDKNAILRDICSYDLLIIDDIGAERSTEYTAEQVYTIIDERYKSNKPVVITTNVNIKTIDSITDLQYKRTYDRLLEMCTPVCVKGQRRRAAGQAKTKKFTEILYGENAQ